MSFVILNCWDGAITEENVKLIFKGGFLSGNWLLFDELNGCSDIVLSMIVDLLNDN